MFLLLWSILKVSLLIGILIDMVAFSNQKCYKTENISNQGSDSATRDRELRIVFYMFRIKHNTSSTLRRTICSKKEIRFLKLTKLQQK